MAQKHIYISALLTKFFWCQVLRPLPMTLNIIVFIFCGLQQIEWYLLLLLNVKCIKWMKFLCFSVYKLGKQSTTIVDAPKVIKWHSMWLFPLWQMIFGVAFSPETDDILCGFFSLWAVAFSVTNGIISVMRPVTDGILHGVFSCESWAFYVAFS